MIPEVKSRPARSALEREIGVELPRRQPDMKAEREEWAERDRARHAERAAERARVEAADAKVKARGFVLATVAGVFVALPIATDAEIAAGGTPIRIG